MKVFVSEEADADLLKTLSYLAERNPSVARSLAQEFASKFQSLTRFPFIGRDRSHLLPGLRSVVAARHVVFYRVDQDRITVVRVLDGRRDIDAEFPR
jgi:toxin ParE1/3/4